MIKIRAWWLRWFQRHAHCDFFLFLGCVKYACGYVQSFKFVNNLTVVVIFADFPLFICLCAFPKASHLLLFCADVVIDTDHVATACCFLCLWPHEAFNRWVPRVCASCAKIQIRIYNVETFYFHLSSLLYFLWSFIPENEMAVVLTAWSRVFLL